MLPALFLAVGLVGAMLSGLGFSLLWRSKVGLQLRLDRCVENTAQELETIQSQIEAANLRMQIERTAALAAAVPTAGSSIQTAKPVLTAEMLFQEGLRWKWRTTQARWILRQGCDGKRDAFLPLPNLEWWRPPEDPIGARPLEWKSAMEKGLSIRLWHTNRFFGRADRKNESRKKMESTMGIVSQSLGKNGDKSAENGQVFLEAILWILFFATMATTYLKLSALDYRKYRQSLRDYESRAGDGSFPPLSVSRSTPTAEVATKDESSG